MNKELQNFKGKLLSGDLGVNKALFKKIFEKDAVFRIREVISENSTPFECCVMFMDGMINTAIVNESIIRPLIITNVTNTQNTLIDFLKRQVLFANEIKESSDIAELISGLLYGDTVLLASNSRTGLIINTKGWRTRGISEPNDERVLQGPREGFDEALMLNLAMLRRKLPTPDLCVEFLKCGRKTDTKIFICYLDSLVNHKTVETVKKRISKIDIDGILDSNYINELTTKNRFSLFKTVGSTERPDVVAARLLEGRLAVMVDGTPVVLTIPYLFVENFQSDEDYYLNFWFASLGRVIRYICYYLSICLPGLYVAVSVYNPQLLPASFLVSLATARGGIPFSSFAECFALILIFEILKETGVRMQQSLGHALSIVGGLVVGQAAVEAKLVSAPLLIIVALSGISGLMIPRLKTSVFYVKIALLLFSASLGLFGFFIGLTLTQIHLYSLNSFGCDYVETTKQLSENSLKDTIIRVPWTSMITRPLSLTKNIVRQKKRK